MKELEEFEEFGELKGLKVRFTLMLLLLVSFEGVWRA